MSSWKILSREFVGYASIGTKHIAVSVATKVEGFNRAQVTVDKLGEKFRKALEQDPSQVSSNADEVCMRMGPHDSDSDPRTHFTVANFENGKQKETCHVKA